jgi:hypothetical protein
VRANLALAIKSSHLNSHPPIAFSNAFNLPVSPIRIAFTINLVRILPKTFPKTPTSLKSDSVLAHSIANLTSVYSWFFMYYFNLGMSMAACWEITLDFDTVDVDGVCLSFPFDGSEIILCSMFEVEFPKILDSVLLAAFGRISATGFEGLSCKTLSVEDAP